MCICMQAHTHTHMLTRMDACMWTCMRTCALSCMLEASHTHVHSPTNTPPCAQAQTQTIMHSTCGVQGSIWYWFRCRWSSSQYGMISSQVEYNNRHGVYSLVVNPDRSKGHAIRFQNGLLWTKNVQEASIPMADACTRTHAHTHARTRTHTRTHTHAHARTHARTFAGICQTRFDPRGWAGLRSFQIQLTCHCCCRCRSHWLSIGGGREPRHRSAPPRKQAFDHSCSAAAFTAPFDSPVPTAYFRNRHAPAPCHNYIGSRPLP